MNEKHLLKEFEFKPTGFLSERKSTGQHVFEHIKQSIVRGDISPGNRLVEVRLADALGVSRTPVREAIHKLEREGLLMKQPKGGFVVLGLSREEIEETFGIRSILEGYAAKMAAIRHKKKELIPLEKKIDEYREHMNRGQLDVLRKINTEFHDLLYALSGSPKLVKMINGLGDQIHRFRKIILNKETLARASHEDHRMMLKHIGKRDAEKVERLVREHILRGQVAVLEEFDKQQGKATSPTILERNQK
ncbi:MAG: GntR family transcriptional regulator [Deltaproteobacteria bacterium]|nr:GntR family transcriptional regulator [Deltaproteobacteria bacterium]